MELIFAWIYESANKIVSRQGFNFSPQYNFVVREIDENHFCLEQDLEWIENLNIFKKERIENLSVIIGKNGCGKTELLNHMLTLRDVDLRIFKEDDRLIIEKNISADYEIEYGSSIPVPVNIISHEFSPETISDLYEINDISIFYFTNSMYTREPSRFREEPVGDEWYLSPTKINSIGAAFYQEVYRKTSRSLLNQWISRFEKYNFDKSIEPICDALLYNWLVKEKRLEQFPSKIADRMYISIPRIEQWLQDQPFIDSLRINPFTLPAVTNAAAHTNLYRKCCQLEKDSNIQEIAEKLLLMCLIESLLKENNETISYYLIHSANPYFYWKLTQTKVNQFEKEIDELRAILADVEIINREISEKEIIYELICNEKLLLKIMDFLQHKWMVFFRYVKVSFSNMSSGERSFNNMFSWPLFISYCQQYINVGNAENTQLKKNILFMIDECDLYLHPEWQKKMISQLIEAFNAFFPTHKIQLLLATHSPLCLSDVPNEHIIYLNEKNDNNHMQVDERRNHHQTFGKDIYSLLDDAFYLKETMGDFAQAKINEIITRVNAVDKNTNDEDLRALQKEIKLIGNDIIRHKLEQILSENEEYQKRVRIAYLRRQKELIEKQLKELSEQNDQD